MSPESDLQPPLPLEATEVLPHDEADSEAVSEIVSDEELLDTPDREAKNLLLLYQIAGFYGVSKREITDALTILNKKQLLNADDAVGGNPVVEHLTLVSNHQHQPEINTDRPEDAIGAIVMAYHRYHIRSMFDGKMLRQLQGELIGPEANDPGESLQSFIDRNNIPISYGSAQLARYKDLGKIAEQGKLDATGTDTLEVSAPRATDPYTNHLTKGAQARIEQVVRELTIHEAQQLLPQATESEARREAFWLAVKMDAMEYAPARAILKQFVTIAE